MDRGAWWATVHGCTEDRRPLSARACARTHTHTHTGGLTLTCKLSPMSCCQELGGTHTHTHTRGLTLTCKLSPMSCCQELGGTSGLKLEEERIEQKTSEGLRSVQQVMVAETGTKTCLLFQALIS